jgi:hypothetical protein
MSNNYKESQDYFKIKFYGADNIDASTLAVSLNSVVASLKDISSEAEPQAYAKLYVTSTQKGCFEITLSTIVKYAASLFTSDNVNLANTVLLIFLNSLLIKQHLKGKPPKEIKKDGDKRTVVNQIGESFETTKNITKTYFGSSTIDNRMVNIFCALNADENRDDILFEIKENKVRIKKEEYKEMSLNIIEAIEKPKDLHTYTIETPLLLKKPDLLGRSKWGFVFDKNIEVEIKDETWIRKVHRGEIKQLYAGVKIPVKLLVEVELDEYKDPKGIPKYTVLEVTGDPIEPSVNMSLFDD